MNPNGISFRLGEPLSNHEPFDLPLRSNGSPLVGDERNNENVILRQIQVMFLKLHNLAVEESVDSNPQFPPAKHFRNARDCVRWQYQYLVRHDYLKRVCKGEVLDDVITNGPTFIDWESDPFSIPVEMAQAVLRFGHSMVRAAGHVERAERRGRVGGSLLPGTEAASESEGSG